MTEDERRLGVRMVRCRECGGMFNAREAIENGKGGALCGKCATDLADLQRARAEAATAKTDPPPATKRTFTLEISVLVIENQHPSDRRTMPIRLQCTASSHLEAASALALAIDNLLEGE